jgi:hypothetical protein
VNMWKGTDAFNSALKQETGLGDAALAMKVSTKAHETAKHNGSRAH